MEPSVLSNPAPRVNFTGFGNNSLDFELRVWVEPIDKEPDIRSSLNFLIEYYLRQHHIQIPFPQRDLWLRNPEVLFPPRLRRKTEADSSEFNEELPPKQLSKPLSIKDLLQQVTYFHNFTDIELRQFIEIGYRKRLHPAEILFHGRSLPGA